MVNGVWHIPEFLSQMFPNLENLVNHAIIPLELKEDKLLWKHFSNGSLELKHAYLFKLNNTQDLRWTKIIWNKDILPLKSLMVW